MRPVSRAGSPSVRPSRAGVVGMDVQRAAAPCPARAGRGCASTSCSERSWRRPDEHDAAVGAPARARARSRADVGHDRLGGASSTLPLGVRSDLRQPRLERAEVDAVRRRLERGERRPARARRSVAVRPHAQHRRRAAAPARRAARARRAAPSVSAPAPRGAGPRRPRARSKASTSASGPCPAATPASRSSVRHSSGCAGSSGSTARRVVRHVARGQLVEGDVVVRALQRRRRAAGSTSAWRVVSLR